ncbi:MAG: Coenzyme F420 hydrogenase/dehydrogenase, beta subunit C-terminal domain [Candidatus Bathyarchaeota archaeon]|nr:Coenzyme F420 hydrogenase/dehydrogenase, beta subunit C-terminal domain [Candidatus Bathyarchaeota archaeon]
MKPAIEVIGKNKCAGCYACYSSCPTQAIRMELDDEGFLFPNVDSGKCVSCGECQHYCPIITPVENSVENPKIFASWSKNKEIILASSSGGIFSEIANVVLKKNGVVFGAAFDENFTLKHCVATNEKELAPLRGSKYIQSHIGNAYESAVSLAKQGKPVLFCGTPCQTAALKLYLKNKKLDKQFNEFYICDLICHGVVSELFFNKYLENICAKSVLVGYSFRDKKLGWENYGQKATFKDKSAYFKSYRTDPFMVGYLKNLLMRPSCYSCPFAKVPRSSDLTIGDFWGVPFNLYNRNGVSIILTNTTKAEKLFEQIEVVKFPISLDVVLKENPRVNSGSMEISQRTTFFNVFKAEGYEKACELFLTRNLVYPEWFLWFTPLYKVVLGKLRGHK